jgi:hypothetical protein
MDVRRTAARSLRPALFALIVIATAVVPSALAADPGPLAPAAIDRVAEAVPDLADPSTSAVAPAAFVPGNVHLSFARIARGLSQPVFVTQPPADSSRLFVVEQGGRIRLIRRGVVQSTPFLDLRSKVSTGGERGLLGLAFHPDYSWNRKFYVNYTDRNGNTVIEQYVRSATNANRANPTPKLVIRITQPYANHNGGMLAFGPDRYLYVGMGDGGSAGDPGNRAQDINSLLGKILRINVDTRGPTRSRRRTRTSEERQRPVWSIGCATRALLVRQGDRRPLIGDVGRPLRGDRPLAGTRRGPRRELRLAGPRGRPLLQPVDRLQHRRQDDADHELQPQPGLLGDRRLRLPRLHLPRPQGRLPVRRLLLGQGLGIDAAGPNAQAPVLLFQTTTSLSSFGQDAAGNLYLVDRNGEIWFIKDN